MAQKRRSRSVPALPVAPDVRALDRIGRLLAMLATKGLNQKDQVLFLKGAGFEIAEIAEIADITPHHVSVTLHDAKKPKGKRPSGRKPKK